MRNGINKLAKILIISINKDKVTVTNGGEILLVTNNNINAYLKLYEAQEFVQNYTLKDKQILDTYIENGDHKLVNWSEAKKSKLVVTVAENVWKLSIIGKVYHGKI